MKIAVDLQSCQTDSRDRGIGRYAFSLASTMVAVKDEGTDIVLTMDSGDHTRMRDLRGRLRRAGIEAPALTYHYPVGHAGVTDFTVSFTRTAGLLRSRFMQSLGADVVLVTSFFEGFDGGAGVTTALDRNSLGGIPTAVVAYDLIPLLFPERYLPVGSAFAPWYRKKLEHFKSFDLYLAISEATRDDLVNQLGIDASRIRVIGAGLNVEILHPQASERSGTDSLAKHGINHPFVLTVGNGDWRKNNLGAIEAFAALPDAVRDAHQLVLTQVGDDVHEVLAGRFSHLAHRIVVLGRVSDATLAMLYRACRVFFFPSLYEGFGLPVLEAMAFGTPTLSSRLGALAEVVPLEKALFDPRDTAEAASLLRRVLTDDGFRAELAEGAAEHAAIFTWDRCAQAALDAMKELAVTSRRWQRTEWVPCDTDILVLADGLQAAGSSGEMQVVQGLEAIAQSGRRRILIDMTCVVITEARTGIQRVVRNYCIGMMAEARARGDIDIVPIRWTETGIRSARAFARSELGLDLPGDDELIEALPNDVVFMLDSTWEWPERFDPLLDDVWRAGGEVVWMVYDLVPIRVPETCHPGMPPVFRSWLTHAIHKTDGFICISEATRVDLEEFIDEVFDGEARRPWTRSVHLGSDLESGRALPTTPATQNALEAIGDTPFLFALGTVEPRKDHATIVEAFEKLWRDDVDVALVIVGKMGWNVDALADRLRLHREAGKRLFWLEGASDGDLQQLLNSAAALIQASIAEGFGLPIVEAGSQGVSLILSDIPVFREIAGGEATYFAAGDVDDLTRVIQEGIRQGGWPKPTGIRTMTWRESSARLAELLLC